MKFCLRCDTLRVGGKEGGGGGGGRSGHREEGKVGGGGKVKVEEGKGLMVLGEREEGKWKGR